MKPNEEHLSAVSDVTPVEVNDDWRSLVVRHEGSLVHPVSAGFTDGTGADIAPLLTTSGQTTRIELAEARGRTLILDFGRQVIGFVEIGLSSRDTATLRASYSQFREYLGPEGDDMDAPFGTDAQPWSRFDLFPATGVPSEVSSPGKREFRYMALTSDEPGAVVINFVRVRQTIYPIAYDSYFISSDELLDRAWYHGAYTGELASVTENGSPWMLTTPFDRVLFMADLHMQGLAGYYQSSDYRWLMRNSLERFGTIQKPDGSLPCAASHLVTPAPGDPGPPDGWRAPEEGPDPDEALGFIGSYSLYHDVRINSFTAFWVAALADHYRYSADSEFIRPLLPVARRAMEFLESQTREDGLFCEPEDQRTDPGSPYPFVANWSPGDTASGVDSFSNAVFYDALCGLALLEQDVADRPGEARRLVDRAENLRESMIGALWDADSGAMVLNLDDRLRDHTGDAVAGALVFELLDPEQQAASIDFLDEHLTSPFGTLSSQYPDNPYRRSNIQGYINALDALGRVRAGDGEGAAAQIRTWWRHMLDNGPGTGWFAWENDGSIGSQGFANSPWTTPVPALAEGILGIRPLEPGYRRWRVAPQPSGLEWAQGRVPTPAGGLSSRWRITGRRFTLTVDGPPGSTGEVRLPFPTTDGTVTLDGTVICSPGSAVNEMCSRLDTGEVVIADVSGHHTFTVDLTVPWPTTNH